ncbi:MBL fold metallo-hydrolase [Candidatus Parcubacteria bacterium]|nr:MBL fold metallo-hydrolase [Patescibacteria group bacterium]MCG2689007.1 MBL fold metallo-hydrolase [Candidatus Parcubacteria bacterium]
MQIYNLGYSCFKIKGAKCDILCNPYNPKEIGLSYPSKQTADIVAVSSSKENFLERIDPGYFLINMPGEYEIKGAYVWGYKLTASSRAFMFLIDGFKIAYLGKTNQVLSDDLAGEFSEADIAILPIECEGCLDAEGATEVVSQIEPKIVIPSYYKTSEAPKKFVDAMGKIKTLELDKLSLKSPSDLPKETELVIIK